MQKHIALLSDFGLCDPYVAQMKGAILSAYPEARIFDISHGVEPFNLTQGGFFLNASRRHFPEGTVIAAVIDPGVGGPRRIVLVEKDGQSILAPDNGLLGLVLAADGDARAYDVSEHMKKSHVSSTFHGRDVFAPLAARLAMGEDPATLGHEISPDDIERKDWAQPYLDFENKQILATVLHVDRFGNCILNISDTSLFADICGWHGLTLSSKHRTGALACCSTYAELPLGGVGLLIGSQGYLELSMNQASAARLLSASCGTAISIAATLEP